jgi:hypothetical protein
MRSLRVAVSTEDRSERSKVLIAAAQFSLVGWTTSQWWHHERENSTYIAGEDANENRRVAECCAFCSESTKGGDDFDELIITRGVGVGNAKALEQGVDDLLIACNFWAILNEGLYEGRSGR